MGPVGRSLARSWKARLLMAAVLLALLPACPGVGSTFGW